MILDESYPFRRTTDSFDSLASTPRSTPRNATPRITRRSPTPDMKMSMSDLDMKTTARTPRFTTSLAKSISEETLLDVNRQINEIQRKYAPNLPLLYQTPRTPSLPSISFLSPGRSASALQKSRTEDVSFIKEVDKINEENDKTFELMEEYDAITQQRVRILEAEINKYKMMRTENRTRYLEYLPTVLALVAIMISIFVYIDSYKNTHVEFRPT